MKDSLLSLDVGTSSLKATLYDLKGKMLSKEVGGYSISSPLSGWAEQNPQDWWNACCIACRKITEEKAYRVLAVCVSGQAPGCVPVNLAGDPVRPAILWLDRRSSPQAEWLMDRLALSREIYSGLNTIDSFFGGVKWLWYRQNEPQNVATTWKILQANGFIIHHLTGEAVIDPGYAGLCTPCFDIEKQNWSKSICDLMEIDPRKLPDVHPAGKVVGEVTKAAAQSTGVPAGTPVVCGTADFICSYLGSGVSGDGTAAIMLGTAGNLMFLSPPTIDVRFLNTFYITNEVISTGGVLAGAAVQWFVNMLKIDDPDLLALLDSEAARLTPGADGLLFLPYLLGERSPIWDPDARGVYLGLSMEHTRAHLYRALLEGTAFAFRQLADILKENGASIGEAVVMNGGSVSALWRQIIADVLEIPIRYRPSKDSSSLGGAFLAGLGVGIFDHPAEIQSWQALTIDSIPRPENREIYRKNYSVYASLYEKLKGSFHALRATI